MQQNKGWHWDRMKTMDMVGKPLSEIKGMNINSLECVRVKGGESEYFKINSSVRQSCIMSP